MLFLKIFAIFTGKHLCWSFFNKAAGLKAYFEEHLRTVTSFNQEVFYRNQTCHYFSSFFFLNVFISLLSKRSFFHKSTAKRTFTDVSFYPKLWTLLAKVT